jgi:hypothetical protein
MCRRVRLTVGLGLNIVSNLNDVPLHNLPSAFQIVLGLKDASVPEDDPGRSNIAFPARYEDFG